MEIIMEIIIGAVIGFSGFRIVGMILIGFIIGLVLTRLSSD